MSIPRPTPHLATESPWLGVNFWSRQGGPLMWRDYDDALVREELRTLSDHGVRLTRSFFFWPDFHPAPDTIDEIYVDRYRAFLQANVDIGMQTIPTFIVGHMSGQNWDVTWRDGRDIYSDGFVLGQQAFFIREMTLRLADSPAIAGWLISNEIPLYGGLTTPEYARAWGLICVDAVRAGGSSLPVSLGDGAWTREIIGSDNGFRLRDQLDVVDFVGPHSYPMGDDQTRQMTRAAFVCEMAHLGKPVVLEEFGVTSAFVSEEHAGNYYRQVLALSLLAGAIGWIGWNNTDFDLTDQQPYNHHLYELNFGVTTSTGEPKAALLEMQQFGRLIDAIDVDSCTRADTGTAILVPSFLDVDHPMIDDQNRAIIPDITQHAYIAAKRADLAPALVRESEGVPAADLLLVPSVKALLGPTFATLLDRVRAGSHVYIGFFAGATSDQRGAWWPHLEPIFGVRHRLRYGLNDHADGVVQLTAVAPLGDLPIGSTLSFPTAGPDDARAFLPIEVVDPEVEVVLSDEQNRPALVRRRLGSGSLYLGTYPVEYFGAVRPDANEDDSTWRLYRALAHEAGLRPDVTVDDARIVVDRMVRDDGASFVWLVNTSADEVSVKPEVADGRGLVDVLDGADLTAGLTATVRGQGRPRGARPVNSVGGALRRGRAVSRDEVRRRILDATGVALGKHPQQQLRGVRSEARDIAGHGRQCGSAQPAQHRVVPGDDGQIGGHPQPQLARHRETGKGHQVVVVDDRGGWPASGENGSGGSGALLVGVVGGHAAGFDRHCRSRGLERPGTDFGVHQRGRSTDPGDTGVTQSGEVVHHVGHRQRVVTPHRGQIVRLRRPDHHAGHTRLLQPQHSRVVDLHVGDEHGVDMPLGPPALVDLDLGLDAAGKLQHQGDLVGAERLLDSGEQLHVELFAAQALGGASQHQAHRPTPGVRQGPRSATGTPAEVRGGLQDALPGAGRHPGTIVQGEGHRSLRHPDRSRDVSNSRSPHHPSFRSRRARHRRLATVALAATASTSFRTGLERSGTILHQRASNYSDS